MAKVLASVGASPSFADLERVNDQITLQIQSVPNDQLLGGGSDIVILRIACGKLSLPLKSDSGALVELRMAKANYYFTYRLGHC